MIKFFITGLVSLGLMAKSAWAHSGVHGDAGFVDGIMHQITQADHLSMLLVAAFGMILAGFIILKRLKAAQVKR